jgi:hypothetical protein
VPSNPVRLAFSEAFPCKTVEGNEVELRMIWYRASPVAKLVEHDRLPLSASTGIVRLRSAVAGPVADWTPLPGTSLDSVLTPPANHMPTFSLRLRLALKVLTQPALPWCR